MTEYLHNFHFLRPWFLLLLAIPVILYFLYSQSGNIQSSWQKVINKRLLGYLLIKGSAKKRRLFTISAFVAGILAVIAISGPSFNKIEIPYFETQNPVMLVLNLSSDMKEQDLPPSRLSRAKYKINDFLNMAKGVQTGLIVYSSEPFMISPVSEDEKIIANLLPAVDFNIMPANGDRLDRAISLAVERIKSSGYNKGQIVVFTSDVGQRFDLALEEAEKAKKQGFIVNIIGVTASENDKLSMIAKSGGGEYLSLQSNDAEISKLATGFRNSDGKMQKSKNSRTIWLDSGWYLIPAIMLLCLLFFRKGILVVALMLFSTTAHAGFFTNSNQDGYKEFSQNNYQKAAEYFTDSNWKAASYYRLGDYQNSLKQYQKDNSVTGMYNQGNALAKGGKIAEAIKKYEELLAIEPSHEDAKFNLEYLKKQQQNQQQQPKPNPDKKPDENENQKDNQQQNDNSDNQSQADKNNQQQDQQNNNQQNQNSDSDANNQNQSNGENNEQPQNNQNQNSSSSEEMTGKEKDNENQSKQGGAIEKEGDNNEKYDEKMQAKARQYREIPEDPGGLLKALIYQEYRQNRYNEQ